MKTREPLPVISIHRPPVPRKRLLGSFDRTPGRLVRMPTPDNPMIVSASELRDFLRCRFMWNLRHQVRIEPKARSENLAIGTVAHEGRDRFYQLPARVRYEPMNMARIARKVTRDTTIEQLSTPNRDLVEAMLNGFSKWAKKEDKKIGMVDAFPEEKFDLPLNDDGSIRIRGKIDSRFVPKGSKRMMAMCETKTAKQINTDKVELNLQLSVYLWALRMKHPGMREYQCHFEVWRKQMPGPRVKAALFAREPITRSDEEIEQWRKDTVRICYDMLDAAIYASPMDSCSWSCDYKMPCLLRGDAADLKHVLTTEYQAKPSHHDKEKTK